MARMKSHRQGKVITKMKMAKCTDLVENILFRGRLKELWTRMIHKAELVAGERVVDIGCGPGEAAIMASGLILPDGEVSGVDASAEMVTLARRKVSEILKRSIIFLAG
ncbi:MAG: methyltransferase domain-containing protein [Thermodesulfobacteriota bacterium]